MKADNRRQKAKKRFRCPSDDFQRTSTRSVVQPAQSDLEYYLIEQRKRHEIKVHDGSSQPVTAPKENIPGFVYDTGTDRYYHVSQATTSYGSIANLRNKNHPASSKPAATAADSVCSVASNYINLLSQREVGSINTSRPTNIFLRSKVITSSLLLEPQYENLSNRHNADSFSDTDISYHPVFGIARTSSHSISTCNGLHNSDTSIDLISFTRLGASSNPHWRPSLNTSFTEKATLAALVHSPTFVQTVLLHQNDESSINSNSQHVPGEISNRPSWIVSKVGGLGSKDQGSVRKIEWHSNRNDLFLLCETGIWMNNIERSSTPHNASMNINLSDRGLPMCTMILSTQSSDDRNIRSQAVAICNSILSDSMKFVGYRNGDIAILDLRSRPKSMVIGTLPYCVDHIECMRDEVTLIGQDITGQISLYDCRVAGRSNNIEAMRIVSGSLNEIRKVRRFWLSPDENFIVAPRKLVTNACKDRNLKSCSQPGLIAYSLRQLENTMNLNNCCEIGDNHDDSNILARIDLIVPNNHLWADRSHNYTTNKPLIVVPSTVKMASYNNSFMDCNSAFAVKDPFCGGLYCVADVVQETYSDLHSSTTAIHPSGSVLFKARCK